jgi:hypothetical protein
MTLVRKEHVGIRYADEAGSGVVQLAAAIIAHQLSWVAQLLANKSNKTVGSLLGPTRIPVVLGKPN